MKGSFARFPAPSHNLMHFCARELGAISDAYPVALPKGNNERESMCYGPNCGRIFGRIETVEI
jgi:hypothetical protein